MSWFVLFLFVIQYICIYSYNFVINSPNININGQIYQCSLYLDCCTLTPLINLISNDTSLIDTTKTTRILVRKIEGQCQRGCMQNLITFPLSITFDSNNFNENTTWNPSRCSDVPYNTMVPGVIKSSNDAAYYWGKFTANLTLNNYYWRSDPNINQYPNMLLYIVNIGSYFRCNNCTFEYRGGINYICHPTMVISGAIFNDCVFKNINGKPSETFCNDDETGQTFIYQYAGEVSFNGCQFMNIDIDSFVTITNENADINRGKSIKVTDCNFINSGSSSEVYFINGYSNIETPRVTHIIRITNLYFEGFLRNELISTEEKFSGSFIISNLTMVGSDTTSIVIAESNLVDNQMMSIGGASIVSISDSIFMTKLNCNYNGQLSGRYNSTTLLPFCQIPGVFIRNYGTLTMNNIILKSYDYDDIDWSNVLSNNFIQFMVPAYLANEDGLNDQYMSFLVNDNALSMIDIFVDAGFHGRILYNSATGLANVSDMNTLWNNDNGLYFDDTTLKPHTYLKNLGELHVQDSYLIGSEVNIIFQETGSLYITNSILGLSPVLIRNQGSLADIIQLHNVSMKQFGSFYSSLNILYSITDFVNTFAGGVSITPKIGEFYGAALQLYGSSISITNSYIEGITTDNILFFATKNTGNNNADIKNNIIKLSDSVYNFDNLTQRYYNYAFSNTIGNVNSWFTYLNDTLSSPVIYFGERVRSTFTNNELYVDTNIPVFSDTMNNPFIQYDTTIRVKNVLHGNYIEGYGVEAIRSRVVVSVYNYEVNNTGSCLVSPGSLRSGTDENITNIFNNTLTNSMTPAIVSNGSPVTIQNGQLIGYDSAVTNTQGSVRIYDTILINSNILVDDSGCEVKCYQIMTNNVSSINHIRQVDLTCANTTSNTVNIDETLSESFSHSFPTNLILDTPTHVIPGEQYTFGYEISDKYGNIVPKSELGLNFSFLLEMRKLGLDAVVEIENGYCEFCELGVSFRLATVDLLNETYTVQVIEEDRLLSTSWFQIIISECPVGYGLWSLSTLSICTECAVNEFKFNPNILPCHLCGNAEGIVCEGRDDVTVEYNYWFDFDAESDTIITSRCPGGYCCQNINGCHYINDKSSLCAFGRDINTPLCGKCLDGYSELIGTSECAECESSHLYLILVPFMFCLVFGLWLTCFQNYNIYTKEKATEMIKDNKERVVFMDFIKTLNIMVLTVVMYYNQILSYILLYSDLPFPSLTTFLSLFNLTYEFNSSSNNSNQSSNGVCFIKNLNAQNEILLTLLGPVMLYLSILIVYGIHLLLIKFKLCCLERESKVTNALFNATLISLGAVISVFFKILSCRNIGGIMLHFYFPDKKCFNGIWIFALVLIILIILVFLGLYIKLACFTQYEHRQDPQKNRLFRLIKSYKPNKYYWEFIFLSRRILIGFIVFTSTASYIANFILCGLLIFYLIIHVYLNPFYSEKVNIMETLCISLLLMISILIIILDITVPEQQLFLEVFIATSVVIPWILTIYWGIQNVLLYYGYIKPTNLKKIRNRLTRKLSYRRSNESFLSIDGTPNPLETNFSSHDTNNNNNINDNNNVLIPTSSTTSPIINGEIELKPMSSRPNIATTPVAVNNSDQPLTNQ